MEDQSTKQQHQPGQLYVIFFSKSSILPGFNQICEMVVKKAFLVQKNKLQLRLTRKTIKNENMHRSVTKVHAQNERKETCQYK